jgi:hypothetical protein
MTSQALREARAVWKPWYPGELNRWFMPVKNPQNMAVIGFDPSPFYGIRVCVLYILCIELLRSYLMVYYIHI